MARRLRLWSGLVLFLFVSTHLLNHALGAKNIEDIPEPRIKQVLADTKHENLQGLLADVGLGNAMSVMVARRMLERVRYQERPERWEYRLTQEGRDLFPLIAALMAWGDRWLSGNEGPPEILTHRCGARLEPVVRCGSCGGWRGDLASSRSVRG